MSFLFCNLHFFLYHQNLVKCPGSTPQTLAHFHNDHVSAAHLKANHRITAVSGGPGGREERERGVSLKQSAGTRCAIHAFSSATKTTLFRANTFKEASSTAGGGKPKLAPLKPLRGREIALVPRSGGRNNYIWEKYSPAVD